MPRVLIDVTQYVHWPAVSGVQRVLRHLAESWQGDEVKASVGFLDGGSYLVGPVEGFASIVRSRFVSRRGGQTADAATSVAGELRGFAEDEVRADSLTHAFEAYLLPEPNIRADNLSVLTDLARTTSPVPFVLYYDALPLTHPELFSRAVDRDGAITRYHRTISRFENIAFISQHTRHVFETRIARRRLPSALVVRPGADAVRTYRHREPGTPRFAAVGTIEPRKRYPLVLDAFQALWDAGRRYELVVLGAKGSERHAVLDRLEGLSRSSPLRWIADADDEDILDALSSSTALIFLSDAEGYGLPAMEALSVGCPVIVSKYLPALEGLPAGGQLRLDELTVERVLSGVEKLADPAVNARYRAAIPTLELPTWQRFAREIEAWVAMRLRAGGSRRDA